MLLMIVFQVISRKKLLRNGRGTRIRTCSIIPSAKISGAYKPNSGTLLRPAPIIRLPICPILKIHLSTRCFPNVFQILHVNQNAKLSYQLIRLLSSSKYLPAFCHLHQSKSKFAFCKVDQKL